MPQVRTALSRDPHCMIIIAVQRSTMTEHIRELCYLRCIEYSLVWKSNALQPQFSCFKDLHTPMTLTVNKGLVREVLSVAMQQVSEFVAKPLKPNPRHAVGRKRGKHSKKTLPLHINTFGISR